MVIVGRAFAEEHHRCGPSSYANSASLWTARNLYIDLDDSSSSSLWLLLIENNHQMLDATVECLAAGHELVRIGPVLDKTTRDANQNF
jgi:hypothetical protein